MGGHHHHHHGHHDGHDHHGHGAGSGPAFALAVALNLAFVVIEVAAGLAAKSMALIADAGHNLSDVLALLLAWGASRLASRPPSARFTWGLKGSSILAALANAALLWLALGAILLETLQRFSHPGEPQGATMMVVAGIGIAINALCALLFARGRSNDLNLRAAFQHLLADAAVSAGVVIAGLLVMLTGQAWIDPVTSLLITLVIGLGSWSLLREALSLALGAVPAAIDVQAVRGFLADQPGVTSVHDLHVWAMSTTETVLSAHLTLPGGHPGDAFLHELAHQLEHRFGIGHATLQVETGAGEDCALHPDEVV